jgi:hypothetical protein
MRTTSPSQWCASVLMLIAAGAHVPLIQDHLDEAPYIGWSFIALTIVCVTLAVIIVVVDHPSVWAIAHLTCLAAVVAFLASRTVGLPQIGDDVGNWAEPLGFPAVASEVLMVLLASAHLWMQRPLSPSTWLSRSPTLDAMPGAPSARAVRAPLHLSSRNRHA